ncbi:poly(hydroxyalkanoate) granule-associated protein [Variovorax sp. PBS-H4]|uniref:phasin family protein n=1 Tax=Variovorax sp. PBS-H4 TaxID=434008 RepID=UPI0013190713|nr:phasin family protein [Variovorax sp. PBS-H4]VTU20235.1 poly(hydroxyalkanoate) granule-associated protein [Variovorax sp. PBS-H4]
MATRRDETVSVKKKAAAAGKKMLPAKKTGKPAAPRKKAPPAKKVATVKKASQQGKQAGAQGLLRAGLKALGNVRDDVVKRQTNVIESLLGIGQPKGDGAPRGFALESFGIRKFEDVFDQRVATALQRLGMPTAQEVQELREQIKRLLEHLDRIESGRKR